MKKTNKNKKIALVSILIILGTFGFYLYSSGKLKPKESATVTEETTEDGGTIIEIKEERQEPVEKEFPINMSESAVQNAIHGMTHQKVQAEDKWGFVPMTAERIHRLKMVVEKNKDEFTNGTVYLEILNGWLKNDFTNIDDDHNTIWRLQNGTVGEATGIMSTEAERKYISKHYDIVD
jgi:hypothetical protein